jgi:hypothetical protein
VRAFPSYGFSVLLAGKDDNIDMLCHSHNRWFCVAKHKVDTPVVHLPSKTHDIVSPWKAMS